MFLSLCKRLCEWPPKVNYDSQKLCSKRCRIHPPYVRLVTSTPLIIHQRSSMYIQQDCLKPNKHVAGSGSDQKWEGEGDCLIWVELRRKFLGSPKGEFSGAPRLRRVCWCGGVARSRGRNGRPRGCLFCEHLENFDLGCHYIHCTDIEEVRISV
ncbi:hypothetical protein NEOLEDRAFT_1136118 [Neolentinus lepideus HHB14362 ss-1]|uniref:Uncharacterized protein n=1 Tax=Neolentinus lepideus HHB14362 ss-1 TaxID=1314782 RepID=A0A165RD77_9AGAM|nr:hypothetical protein NEOLEDRAFT_1136118 [Neolentinus lepideus HHB14362 ss-1]